jgi:hypothetical protein
MNTIVADLSLGNVVGIGAQPAPPAALPDISAGHAVQYKFTDTAAHITATNRLTCPAAGGGAAANGRFLFLGSDLSTVAIIDASHPMIVSGGFAGCAYKVYQEPAPTNTIYCVHIDRPVWRQFECHSHGRLGSTETLEYASQPANNCGSHWKEQM